MHVPEVQAAMSNRPIPTGSKQNPESRPQWAVNSKACRGAAAMGNMPKLNGNIEGNKNNIKGRLQRAESSKTGKPVPRMPLPRALQTAVRRHPQCWLATLLQSLPWRGQSGMAAIGPEGLTGPASWKLGHTDWLCFRQHQMGQCTAFRKS